MYTANAIRNICLLGHSGSGKTALAESLLYMTGVIDRIGKNADGNTVCDYDPEEIRRNISISTAVVPLEYHNNKINLLDTPGGVDLSGAAGSICWIPPAALISPVRLWKHCALRMLPSLSAPQRTALLWVWRRPGNIAKSAICPALFTFPR